MKVVKQISSLEKVRCESQMEYAEVKKKYFFAEKGFHIRSVQKVIVAAWSGK